MTTQQQQTRIYIVDDNSEAIVLLRDMLVANYRACVVGTATNATTAIADVMALQPDLIFTDVEMPEMSGIELCGRIRSMVKPTTKVVFYTAHDKYMLDAIRQQAFDYLLKPPATEALAQVMTRYYEDKLMDVARIDVAAPPQRMRIMVVNALNDHIALTAADIAYFCFNQERKLWEVTCGDGCHYVLRTRTNADVILRYSPEFVQIHKRYIVNVAHVKMIKDATCILNEPLSDIDELKVSKNFRRALMDAFYAL